MRFCVYKDSVFCFQPTQTPHVNPSHRSGPSGDSGGGPDTAGGTGYLGAPCTRDRPPVCAHARVKPAAETRRPTYFRSLPCSSEG